MIKINALSREKLAKSVAVIRKKLQYSEEALQKAIQAVKSSEENVTSASKKFGIPRQTLDDKIRKRTPECKTKVGSVSVLPPDVKKAATKRKLASDEIRTKKAKVDEDAKDEKIDQEE